MLDDAVVEALFGLDEVSREVGRERSGCAGGCHLFFGLICNFHFITQNF